MSMLVMILLYELICSSTNLGSLVIVNEIGQLIKCCDIFFSLLLMCGYIQCLPQAQAVLLVNIFLLNW